MLTQKDFDDVDVTFYSDCVEHLVSRLNDLKECFELWDSLNKANGKVTNMLTVKHALNVVVTLCDGIELSDEDSINAYKGIRKCLDTWWPDNPHSEAKPAVPSTASEVKE